MSGLKPLPLTEFYRSLRSRGVTTELLAATLGVSTATLSRKITGMRAQRGPVWRGLLSLLTEHEIELLTHVAKSPTWNMRQSARRPRWTPEKSFTLTVSTAA